MWRQLSSGKLGDVGKQSGSVEEPLLCSDIFALRANFALIISNTDCIASGTALFRASLPPYISFISSGVLDCSQF
jgi:hypothetical protein